MALSNDPICTELQSAAYNGDFNGVTQAEINSAITLFYMFQVCMYWVSYRLAQSHNGQGAIGETLATAANNLTTAQTSYISAQAAFPMNYMGIVGG